MVKAYETSLSTRSPARFFCFRQPSITLGPLAIRDGSGLSGLTRQLGSQPLVRSPAALRRQQLVNSPATDQQYGPLSVE